MIKKLALLFSLIATTAHSQPDSPQTVIILFGDSITSTRPHLPDDVPRSARSGKVDGLNVGPTVDRLQKLLNENGKSVIVLNYGWSGTTTKLGAERIESNILAAKALYPNAGFFIGILYGTNDPTVGRLSTAETESNMKTIIDVSLSNNVVPVVGTLLPRLDRDIKPYGDAVISAATARGVRISDHNLFWLKNIELLEKDGLHPTLKGYKLMGDFWFNDVFNEIVPDKKKKTAFLIPILHNLDLLDA